MQVTVFTALLTEHPVNCVDRSVRIQLATKFLNQDLPDNKEILTTSGWYSSVRSTHEFFHISLLADDDSPKVTAIRANGEVKLQLHSF
jgi:hypothetical protein